MDVMSQQSPSLVADKDLAIHLENRPEENRPEEKRAHLTIALLALFEFALIVATWTLWSGRREFPAVPLLTLSLPGSVFAASLLLAATLIIAISHFTLRLAKRQRLWCFLALLPAIYLVLADQHRLQAWHWLFMLSLTVRLLLPDRELLPALRHVIITVYVCSALSRLTPLPAETITGVIVRQLLNMTGLKALGADDASFTLLCHGMTAGEFLVGVLLLCKATRTVGCVAAMLLHSGLLIALGPFGLNHHWGVLLWNLCFLCVVPALFLANNQKPAESPATFSRRYRNLVASVWIFPLSGLIGIADNWPSWQLYSSRPESWILLVHEADRGMLPPIMASSIGEPAPLSNWCPVKLDRWSLEQTSSPMYPEDRFQLAIVEWLLNQCKPEIQFAVQISSPARPFWWRRESRTISSLEELAIEQRRYILGATAVQ